MGTKEVNEARKVLENDLEHAPYTLSAPMGHGLTRKKILKYIYICILSNVSKPECVDWLYKLYNNQSDKEKCLFQMIIDSVSNALYDFYDYLQNNNVE